MTTKFTLKVLTGSAKDTRKIEYYKKSGTNIGIGAFLVGVHMHRKTHRYFYIIPEHR
ncbi:MAG: hypothetical protein UT42_C0024G0007 [Candidatus Falkowbacteria bacterium GW2011_GWA2_39_24]|uniref:Uncharacterized protein n=1 Tax=Candidatus Falkowbacteria bacterium GW2011_GWA2_39_24 TaxID=1618634 RepID=A0A0G0NP44_9BACT|nr:MAG: hypothetical protein UT42_C0024G0007 [Candidatus Falkowbacteria bacterium GW2011_GWA2_39_24]